MSRPWNVADTGSSRHGEAEISTASATPPNRSAAGISRPLSGPTSSRPSSAVRSATARRWAPTSGSTTARCTPAGMYGSARASTVAPARTSWRGMPWREVDDARVRADPGDHAVDDADELVGEPVVGEEGDRARHRAASASSASTRPSGVCGSASRSGSAPWARSSALVAGPIETSRGPSSVRRPRVEEAHRRGGGEEQVVGRRGRGARRRRRAARRPSRRARRRRPRRRARAARRAARRGPRRRGRSARARPATSASASTSPSATARSGHDVGLDAARRAAPARCPGRSPRP